MTISIILLYKSLQIRNSICFIRIIWEILGLFRIKRECPFLQQLRTYLYPDFLFEYFSALLLMENVLTRFYTYLLLILIILGILTIKFDIQHRSYGETCALRW